MTPDCDHSLHSTRPDSVQVFDRLAERYDAWFESEEGRAIFGVEAACVREAMAGGRGRWLEVGVGTGRFAQALGVRDGVDPSRAVLEYARGRGIRTAVGFAERLPYLDAAFDGVVMVVTICFVSDAGRALRECARVLKPGGKLVVGLVPADSPWGRSYAEKGRSGHPFYSAARFYTCEEITRLAREAGFKEAGAKSCLFDPPGATPADISTRPGIVSGAGFAALAFVKADRRGVDLSRSATQTPEG